MWSRYDTESANGYYSFSSRHRNSGALQDDKIWLPTTFSERSDAQLSNDVKHYGVKIGRFGRERPFSAKKCPLNGCLGGNWIRVAWLQSSVRPILSNKGKLWFCPQKSCVHNASNELLGEPLASKVSEQQVDTSFVGGGTEKLQKKIFLEKTCFYPNLIGEDLT